MARVSHFGPAHLLVVDDEPAIRLLIGTVLRTSGHQVLHAPDGETALAICRSERVDLVLLDVAMPRMDGFAVLAAMKAEPRLATIPVVLVTAHGNPEQIAHGLAAGAQDYIAKPFDVTVLDARVAAVLRIKQHTDELRRRSDEAENQRRFLEALLDSLQEGIIACDQSGVVTLFNSASRGGMEDGKYVFETFFDHYELYHGDGRTPMTRLETPLARALAGEVVRGAELVVVPESGQSRVLLASSRAIRGVDGEKMGAVMALHDVTERRAAEAALAHQALHDPLCGLPNRVLFMDRLRAALARGERAGPHPAVLFVDLDRFKQVNDTLGHDGGDEVLVAVAERLAGAVRPSDTVARLGGDEFVVLAEQVSGLGEAKAVAGRLRAAFTTGFEIRGTSVGVTVSVGISVGVGGKESAEDLLRRADAAMYLAKQRGRDRIEIAV